jgi:hypothetical protein
MAIVGFTFPEAVIKLPSRPVICAMGLGSTGTQRNILADENPFRSGLDLGNPIQLPADDNWCATAPCMWG